MEKIKELQLKVQKIINEEKEPEEIKKIIDSILLDYKDAYTVYIRNIATTIQNDRKRSEDMDHIASYVTKDYEEIQETMRTIQIAEEEYRKKEMEEQVIPAIQGLAKEKEQKDLGKVLDGSFLLDDRETPEQREQRQDRELIEHNINGEQKHNRYIKEIKNTIISEIKSSKNMVIKKIKELELNNIYAEIQTKKFEEEIKNVVDKATIDLQRIKQILELQDKKMCNQIISQWEQYREGNKTIDKTKNTAQIQREQFRARISQNVQVDNQAAIEKVQEGEKENNGKTLPGDLII